MIIRGIIKAILLLLGYGLGLIQTGYIFGKTKKMDIRDYMYEIEKTNFIVNNLEYTDKIIYTIYVMEEDYYSFQSWIANLTNGQFKILSTHEKQLEFDIKD